MHLFTREKKCMHFDLDTAAIVSVKSITLNGDSGTLHNLTLLMGTYIQIRLVVSVSCRSC